MRAYQKMTDSRGFTLVEWMIVVLLGLFITAGLTSVFSKGQQNVAEKRSISQLEENGRLALHFISQDLRQVGFWGDYTGNVLISRSSLSLPAGIGSDCFNAIHGSFPYDLIGYTDIYGYTYDSSSATEMSCLTDTTANAELVDGSDVLSLTRAHGDPIWDSPSFDPTRYYLETNFTFAQVFAGNNADDRAPVDNSVVWQYLRHLYFVDRDTDTDIPRLRRWSLEVGKINTDAEPLVEGVEHLRILYMVDGDNDGVGESLVSANEVTDDQWVNQQVVGAQVYVLMRAISTDDNYTNQGSYQLGDLTITVDDGYRRLLVSQTISMRNSLLYQMEKA